jgi:SAM-dependent methyltransferase
MEPASVAHCRVLEIGCTDGGNIIPMAFALPEARFIGIDVSGRAIETGRAVIASLGLTNIELQLRDILDLPADFGVFDYIIAHGIYSWVPAAVREKILEVCRVHLAPQGVAYISYNAHPGGHIRDLVRGMMKFHVREITDAIEQRKHGLALLRFIRDAQPDPSPSRALIAAELESLEHSKLASFYHDDLAANRTAFHFHEFIRDAAAHDLQYLSEAAFHEMQEETFAPEVVNALHALSGDRIAREQYLDFLKFRRFRQTLLCHRSVPLREQPGAEAVSHLRISSAARAQSESAALAEGVMVEFQAPGNASVTIADALSKAALVHLASVWPRAIAFDALWDGAQARLQAAGVAPANDGSRRILAETLLRMYSAPIIQFHAHAPRFTLEPGERPTASVIARRAIASGESSVTNLWHRTVRCDDPLAMQLILLLDGTRDRAALIENLTTFCEAHARTAEGNRRVSSEQLRAMITSSLEENLQKLARMAVLVA